MEIPRAQWNGTLWLHRPDPSHRTFGYCFCKQDTKQRYWGHFGPTDRDKWTTFKGGPEYSGLTKLKWSVPFDVPTEITGILG